MAQHGTIPGGSTGDLRRLAELIAESYPHRFPTDHLTGLVLPMVARAVRTGRGPAALVHWVRQQRAQMPAGEPADRFARSLSEHLVRLLLDPAHPLAETLRDG